MIWEFYDKSVIFILHIPFSWINCKALAEPLSDLCFLRALHRQLSIRLAMMASAGPWIMQTPSVSLPGKPAQLGDVNTGILG